MNDNTIDTTGWPKSLVALVEIVGVGAALQLLDAYAGREFVYIPHKLGEGHELIQAVGEVAARKLHAAAAGDRLPVPTLADRRNISRKRLIAEAKGSSSDVARRFGVTARWVRMVREEPKRDPNQLDLFSPE